MKKSQVEFLDLFFNEGEHVSVTDGPVSFHSVSRDEVESNDILLKAPASKKYPTGWEKNIVTEDINLVCMNPVSGWKRDENITAYRAFLIEVDDLSLPEQKKYIEDSGLPYSICVYSGNKSLHYGVVLERDLPDYSSWQHIAKWILNILDKADQQNISPSRGFRFPDNRRKDGLKNIQALVEMGVRIDNTELYDWLNKHEDKRPATEKKEVEDTEIPDSIKKVAKTDLPVWMLKTLYRLKSGEQDYRNKTWFNLSCYLAKKGIIIDQAIRVFESFFVEESDFSRKEWEMAIKSGYKHIHKKDYE